MYAEHMFRFQKLSPRMKFITDKHHKLDMCLWNTDALGGNKVENMATISKSYILTPPLPQGHVMSVKCEEPKDELTSQGHHSFQL